jgi:nucleotide-binding universal stress UspA family protein
MTRTAGAPIVVGVDGSPSGLAAVTSAARMGADRRRPLRVVHAFVWSLLSVRHGIGGGAPIGPGLRDAAEGFVTDAIALARSVAPDVEVAGEVRDGATAPVLLEESRGAWLLVLGDRGLGGFASMLVGSVTAQLAAHAECPVLMVRPTGQPDGPVLVGVDGSGHSDLAVEFAFEEAAFRRVTLRAVHAWRRPVATEPGDMLPLVYDVGEVDGEETRVLAEALSGWRDRYPDVAVDQMVVRGGAARTLVDESARAQLLVVGARGHGGFVGLLLGSVSRAALLHAACPVAVIRDRMP